MRPRMRLRERCGPLFFRQTLVRRVAIETVSVAAIPVSDRGFCPSVLFAFQRLPGRVFLTAAKQCRLHREKNSQFAEPRLRTT